MIGFDDNTPACPPVVTWIHRHSSSRFISMKFKAVTFIESSFLNCYFEDVSSVGSSFQNCTFVDSFFYNTGKCSPASHAWSSLHDVVSFLPQKIQL